MDDAEIRRLESVEELFALAGDDYLLRTDASPEQSLAEQGAAWYAADGGFAFGGSQDGPGLVDWLTVIGPPGASGPLLRHVLDDLTRPPHGISVPRGTDTAAAGIEVAEPEPWDYMVFDPAWGVGLEVQPGEERVEELLPSPEADAEIGDFLKVANPSHSAKPGWEAIQAWGVVRGANGNLLACGAYCRRSGGNGYLASIGTHPDARGQGLGAAVSGWLTRRSLDRDGFCSLGHWHPNEPARRIYARLGYRTTHRMLSARLVG
ncbi:GNAT family N-acetyltransferase [Catenulispora subtropica]|uniref:GNAT family N-acetyltransferase n=1 Tax=Catenulispora subtropica TaxID=450798 RepID=UPI0031DC0FE3